MAFTWEDKDQQNSQKSAEEEERRRRAQEAAARLQEKLEREARDKEKQ